MGIDQLRNNVDSLIVINNNKLREVYGNLGFKAGFSKADEVLATAAKGIAEVITHHYTQNIDLRDAKTVLSNSGTAIMGSSTASGSSRAQEAITKALDSPLLNDNKITGAKNVLLLIVSGEQEITIDEIGEINDFIQTEAGFGANIIMGVGEDESLGEAIAVTVIATGFDTEQQDTIVNTESKKIVHSLEDIQKVEAIVPIPEPEPVQETVKSAPLPMFQTKVQAPKKIEPEAVVKHTLVLEEEEEPIRRKPSNLIPTTNYIKNFNVFYEEVTPENIEDHFVIVDATENLRNIEVVDAVQIKTTIKEEQTNLSFDLPLNVEAPSIDKEDPYEVVFDLNENVSDVGVNDHIEVVPVLEYNKEGETRYSLDDYMDLENKLTGAQSKAEKFNPKIIDQELIFEKKSIPVGTVSNQSVDPMDTPIEEVLRNRVEERKRKLKDFNYKFQNLGSSVDDIEKEPAYKRQGVSLNDNREERNISRTSFK